MTDKPRIVLAHNERVARETLARDLTQKGYDVRATESFDTLWRWIRGNEADLVLIDVDIPDPARNGFELLKQIREVCPHLPALVLSAENTVLTSLLAARFGAFDYFPKPFSFDQLASSIASALQQPLQEQKTRKSRTDLPLIGSSDPMQSVYRQIAQATQSDLPLLITGETGTGKSLVAKMLHDYGERAEDGYAVLHLPLPEKGFDAALKTAITQAQNGTLVLDELSALSDGQQAQLIRILSFFDDQKHAPRLVTTTRFVVSEHGVVEGISLELLYRLNTLHINLPPLRDRHQDYAELARAFCSELSKGQKTLSDEAEHSLAGRAWPGNVRELRNVIQRATLMARREIIAPDDIHIIATETYNDNDNALEEAIARALAAYLQDTGQQNTIDDLYNQTLCALERPLLKRVMAMADGNQLKAARILGINRNTLHKKLTRYHIRPNQT